MKKLVSVIFGLGFITIALANPIAYEQIPFSPQTWREVDLTYTNMIDGKEYTEHVNLLRPISWIKQNHLDKVETTVHLTKEQLGIDIDVKVIALKPTKLNYSDNKQGNIKPVIATFIKHSKDVWEYTFKDQYGHEEKIRAVADHPFYVPHLNSYVPIGSIKSKEQFKGSSGNNITFLEKTRLNQVESVYNFEIYKNHNYVVGNQQIVVHNQCGCLNGICQRVRNVWQRFRNWHNQNAIGSAAAEEIAAPPAEGAINQAMELQEVFTSTLSTPFPEGTPDSRVMAYDLDGTLLTLNAADEHDLDNGTARLQFIANRNELNKINGMFTTKHPSRQMIVVTAGDYDKNIIQDFFRQTIQQELHETRIFNMNSGVISGEKGPWLANNIVNKGYTPGKITLYDDMYENLSSAANSGMEGTFIYGGLKQSSKNPFVYVRGRPPTNINY